MRVGQRVIWDADPNNDDHIARWGNNEHPRDVIDPGEEYEVARVEVHSWHTKVWLKGGLGPFNSCHFRVAEEVA